MIRLRGPGSTGAWIDGAILLLIALLTRVQVLGNPLVGFDEQFYLLVGERMLHGAIPYVDLFDRKPIGLFAIYAGAAASGIEPFLAYKLLALVFAWLTAWTIAAMARPAGRFGALAAGAAYLVWLPFAEGEGGQAPVFYNLPMALAGWLAWRALDTRDKAGSRGAGAMALAGLAVQIKPTVVIEVAWLAIAMLPRLRAERRLPWLVAWAALLVAPTALVALWYARLGQFDAWTFATVTSQFGRRPDPFGARIVGLAGIAGILLLPLAAGWLACRAGPPAWRRFFTGWTIAALVAMLAVGSFLSPHYLLPVLVPLLVRGAPAMANHGRAAMIGLGAFALLGQVVLHAVYTGKGTRADAMALAAAARPNSGCLYVYDGPPATYLLTGACLATRWPFPGHLATLSEASARAIGTDPVTELRAILGRKPEVILDTAPAYSLHNPATRAVLQAALDRDYRLAASLRVGQRQRLVWRRRDTVCDNFRQGCGPR